MSSSSHRPAALTTCLYAVRCRAKFNGSCGVVEDGEQRVPLAPVQPSDFVAPIHSIAAKIGTHRPVINGQYRCIALAQGHHVRPAGSLCVDRRQQQPASIKVTFWLVDQLKQLGTGRRDRGTSSPAGSSSRCPDTGAAASAAAGRRRGRQPEALMGRKKAPPIRIAPYHRLPMGAR